MRLYLDNCCYNRPYDTQSQVRIKLETEAKLHVQDLIRNKKVELATSYALLYENSKNPYSSRREAIKSFINNNSTVYASPDQHDPIASKARQIMNTGVKYKDALHVSAAIFLECDYFLTTDDRLLRYETDEIMIRNPIDYIRETEAESDG